MSKRTFRISLCGLLVILTGLLYLLYMEINPKKLYAGLMLVQCEYETMEGWHG